MAGPSPSVLQPAGPVAQAIGELAWLLIVGAGVVFVGVMVLLAWVLLRPRVARPGDGGAAARAEARALRWWLVGGGLLLPGGVLAALLLHTTWLTVALVPRPGPQEPVISVIAHSWWWEVRYPAPGGGPDVVLANEVHVPAGRAVTLGLASRDVIHSFWVPQLAGKIDMVPGRVHQLRLQADRPGVYRGQCAEFCGLQHARMALHVIAHAPDDYARWLAAQAQPARPPADARARRGLQVFEAQRCGACHSVRGLLPDSLGLGPDLTHVGSRRHLAAGTRPMDAQALAAWIADAERIKPGVRMPSYTRLDDESLQALVDFLVHLQ